MALVKGDLTGEVSGTSKSHFCSAVELLVVRDGKEHLEENRVIIKDCIDVAG